mmetsp:Transcript_25538/g.66874  ORF Transcript_25538/g.66874 Transcript_25538/m.66874 type:complete len:213 (+) Transcript_25538:1233-1871(+)
MRRKPSSTPSSRRPRRTCGLATSTLSRFTLARPTKPLRRAGRKHSDWLPMPKRVEPKKRLRGARRRLSTRTAISSSLSRTTTGPPRRPSPNAPPSQRQRLRRLPQPRPPRSPSQRSWCGCEARPLKAIRPPRPPRRPRSGSPKPSPRTSQTLCCHRARMMTLPPLDSRLALRQSPKPRRRSNVGQAEPRQPPPPPPPTRTTTTRPTSRQHRL